MAYQRQNFTNGQVLEDKHLRHIEDGILALEKKIADGGIVDIVAKSNLSSSIGNPTIAIGIYDANGNDLKITEGNSTVEVISSISNNFYRIMVEAGVGAIGGNYLGGHLMQSTTIIEKNCQKFRDPADKNSPVREVVFQTYLTFNKDRTSNNFMYTRSIEILDNNYVIINDWKDVFADFINLIDRTAIGKKNDVHGEIFNDLEGNIASGDYSHAEGHSNKAEGFASHAEGEFTQATTLLSHTEGNCTATGIKGYKILETNIGITYGVDSDNSSNTAFKLSTLNDLDTNESCARKLEVGVKIYALTTYTGEYDEFGNSVDTGVWKILELGKVAEIVADQNVVVLDGWAPPADNFFHVVGDNGGGTPMLFVEAFNDDIRDVILQGPDAYALSIAQASDLTDQGILSNRQNGGYSHAEGTLTQAIGNFSHAEGNRTKAIGNSSHTEGQHNIARGGASHAEGIDNEVEGSASHVEGSYNSILGYNSHGEGSYNTVGEGNANCHVEGDHNTVAGDSAHVEGSYNAAYGARTHVEGNYCEASGDDSHAEGKGSKAAGIISHAEGNYCEAKGNYSHAEGNYCVANGENSHVEGYQSRTNAGYSHAEGKGTEVIAAGGHAEGYYTKAGYKAHAEGEYTKAVGERSHAEGYGTEANGANSHVQGRYNIIDNENKYAHIVGNGNMDNNGKVTRSNAHTVDWDGNAWYAGHVEADSIILRSSTKGSTKKFKVTVDDNGTLTAVEI